MQTIIEPHLPDKNAKLVSLHKKQLQFEDTSYLPLCQYQVCLIRIFPVMREKASVKKPKHFFVK